METQFCRSCAHYHQHYALDKERIFRVYCGHCTLAKVKRKRPDTVACEFFVPALPDESAFASKEYLSKTLLQYLLNLEILPTIEDSKDLRK